MYSDIHIELKGGSYYGDVQVRRYGVSGSMCDEGWDDNDATVLCRSIGFVVGYATNGTNIGGDPMLLTSVDCDGNESSISNCKYPPLSKEFACNSRSTRAAAVCSMDDGKRLLLETLFPVVSMGTLSGEVNLSDYFGLLFSMDVRL